MRASHDRRAGFNWDRGEKRGQCEELLVRTSARALLFALLHYASRSTEAPQVAAGLVYSYLDAFPLVQRAAIKQWAMEAKQ